MLRRQSSQQAQSQTASVEDRANQVMRDMSNQHRAELTLELKTLRIRHSFMPRPSYMKQMQESNN